jgi:hypothetical protein
MSGSESGTADPYAVRGVAAAPEAGTRKVFPGGPRAESRWLHGIILLSIPALVLFRQTNAIFNDAKSIDSSNFVDSWLYLGFFRNFVDFKRYLFTDTYYASRMSWILPGWLINVVFSPEIANYVIHLGVFYLLVFSLYFAVSRLANPRAALVAALTGGFYPYLWRAVGSDYVDGAGIAYYMAGFALLTRAAFSHQRRMSLILAGVFAAAAIHTNLFWCVPASLLAMHYCAMAMIQTKQWRKAIYDLLLCYPAGFLALTGLLAAINYWVVGYPWFYMASIRFLRSSGTVSRYAHYGAFGWPLHQWLKYPLVTLLAAFAITAVRFWKSRSRKNLQAVLVVAHLGLLFAIFAVFEGRGTSVLTLEYYASYLIPLTFLALGVALPSIETRRAFIGWTIAVTGALSCAWWIYSTPIAKEWTATSVLPVVLFIVMAGLVRHQPAAAVASAIGLGLLTYSVRPDPGSSPTGRRDAFRRLMQAGSRIEFQRQGRPLRFWYDLQEPNGAEFRALCSLYLNEYSLISERFPFLPDNRDLEPGVLLVMPTNRNDVPARALNVLKRNGLEGAVKDAGPIGEGRHAYHLYTIVPQFDAQATEPMSVVLDPAGGSGRLILSSESRGSNTFPTDGWTLCEGPGAWMHKLADGILLHTVRASWAIAAKYTRLTSEIEGDYHFTLRYSSDLGNAGFGALKGDESGWLQALNGTLLGKVSTVGFTIHLKQGEQFRLALSNSHAGNLASQIAVKELTATRLKAAGDAPSSPGRP